MYVKQILFHYGEDAEGQVAYQNIQVDFEIAPDRPGGNIAFGLETDDLESVTLGEIIRQAVKSLAEINEVQVIEAIRRKAVPQP